MGTFGHHLPIILVFISLVAAPPPKRQEAEAKKQDEQHENDGTKPTYQLSYMKYLQNVVQILENHTGFAEVLRTMSQDDIKTGKIADHMDILEDTVFKELTQHKLDEINRLREEIRAQMIKEPGAGGFQKEILEHLDTTNMKEFGREDLRKLIVKAVADMEEMDKKRRDDFKEYEMQKKAEEDHKLAQMSPEERLKTEKEIEEAKKKRDEHEKVNHPGGREQLEDVWENTDGMDKDNFDPKSFFHLHDLNGDELWNMEEVDALFQSELDKIYNGTDDDVWRERVEEMNQMREHVMKQMDTNNDRMISLQEFLSDQEAQTPTKNTEDWQDIAHQQIYTEEELKKFEAEYAKQQGWGEYAYETTQSLGQDNMNHINAQQGHVNQYPQPGQAQHQGQHVPQQPVGQQQPIARQQQVHSQGQQAQYQQPVQGQPQYQQQQPVQGQPQYQQQQPVQGQPQYQQQVHTVQDQNRANQQQNLQDQYQHKAVDPVYGI